MPLVAVAAAVASSVTAHRIVRSYREGMAITCHQVPWKGSAKVRVVQLSDVHVGPSTPQRMLMRVAEVTKTLQPDLVVLTGDYVNLSAFFAKRVTDFVERLPKPCLAVLGNHNHWANATAITDALTCGGAKVLSNEATTVRFGRTELSVVGLDDGCTGNDDIERAFRGVDAERALVLSHYPNTADDIAKTGAPLVLSGHTHAGHFEVPWLTRSVARAAGHPYLHGFYRCGAKTDLYVTAGIGHSLPGLRAGGARPEIAVFDLDPAATVRRSQDLRADWR